MAIDPWLPVGFQLPDGLKARMAIHEGLLWQIYDTNQKTKALIVKDELAIKWFDKGLVSVNSFVPLQIGKALFHCFLNDERHLLEPVSACIPSLNKGVAMMFADSLKLSRKIEKDASFEDAIYIEKLSRLLPSYSLDAQLRDDVVLGMWLCGGVHVSINSTRRIASLASWFGEAQIHKYIKSAGLEDSKAPTEGNLEKSHFTLPGRSELEGFFNEYIIDVIKNEDRYKALGVGFPSAFILHGPPGCGKTFAVEKLVEYLEWPSFEIDASSIASPYIHETSRKIASIFDQAIENAPAVIVIDEMDAFLASRQSDNGQHHVEEVSEFLRRIPEAAQKKVLIIGMTNRIDAIDAAILRRGRIDHIIKVDMASTEEIASLLQVLISELPHEDININDLALELSGRPLSDVSYVVRESARISAKMGKTLIDQESIRQALDRSLKRESDQTEKRIGFV